MKLSILIVNHNTATLLRDLLVSIRENVGEVDYEIIVVDNASQDNSRQMLHTEFPEVRVIENETNAGFSKANNQAARQAEGELLLFLNPDTLVHRGAIEAMAALLHEKPEAGAVGCKLLNEDGSVQRSCGIDPTLKTEFNTRTFLSRLFPNHSWFGGLKLAGWDYDTESEVDWATGACLMVRTELFRQLGGFDEQLYMFYEDSDLCLRIRRHGFQVWFVPTAQVVHLHGGSWKSRRDIPIINSARSAVIYFKKHKGKTATMVVRLLILVEVLIGYFILTPFLLLKREPMAAIQSRLRGYSACLRGLTRDNNNKQ